MIRVILDWIVEVPNRSPGRSHQVSHGAVFEKRGFEGALAKLTPVNIRRSRSAGPDLRDIAIATIEPRQARLRTYNVPVRIIEQAMSGHITTRVTPGSLVKILDEIKD